jgi:hypothetical protein
MADAGSTATSVAEDGQLGLVDLDGDGYEDLVLLTGTALTYTCLAIDSSDAGAPTGAAESTARALVVFWNDTNGSFGLGEPVVVASCGATACGGSARTCPESFAAVNSSESALPTLAFVTSDGVWLARFTSARTLLPVGPASAPDAGAVLPGVHHFEGISAGDVNGDGVDDLAVTADGALYILAGEPVLQ